MADQRTDLYPCQRRDKKQETKRKQIYLEKLYDKTQYIGPAKMGCEQCKYLAECKQNLWTVRQGEGLLYEPLRCFKEHPLYKKEEWVMR